MKHKVVFEVDAKQRTVYFMTTGAAHNCITRRCKDGWKLVRVRQLPNS